jgi:hypothetical protein
MQIVILSYPETWDTAGGPEPFRPWTPLEAFGSLACHQSTTLPEFLERALRADILVTTEFPLRRELLDYATRPQIILVPTDRMTSLVELSIAKQLGIAVLGVPGDTRDAGIWVRNAAETLADHMRSANRQK